MIQSLLWTAYTGAQVHTLTRASQIDIACYYLCCLLLSLIHAATQLVKWICCHCIILRTFAICLTFVIVIVLSPICGAKRAILLQFNRIWFWNLQNMRPRQDTRNLQNSNIIESKLINPNRSRDGRRARACAQYEENKLKPTIWSTVLNRSSLKVVCRSSIEFQFDLPPNWMWIWLKSRQRLSVDSGWCLFSLLYWIVSNCQSDSTTWMC